MALSYEEGKKVFLKTILILGAITIGEVAFALIGKGHIFPGIEFPGWLIGGVMILMSVVKAYLIIYEFMHMKYEVKGLVRTVLLPAFLLVWGVIAFLWDGTHWMDRRDTDSERIELTVPVSEHDGAHGDTHGEDHGGHGHDDHGHDHH